LRQHISRSLKLSREHLQKGAVSVRPLRVIVSSEVLPFDEHVRHRPLARQLRQRGLHFGAVLPLVELHKRIIHAKLVEESLRSRAEPVRRMDDSTKAQGRRERENRCKNALRLYLRASRLRKDHDVGARDRILRNRERLCSPRHGRDHTHALMQGRVCPHRREAPTPAQHRAEKKGEEREAHTGSSMISPPIDPPTPVYYIPALLEEDRRDTTADDDTLSNDPFGGVVETGGEKSADRERIF
jgi:hypothetical protein